MGNALGSISDEIVGPRRSRRGFPKHGRGDVESGVDDVYPPLGKSANVISRTASDVDDDGVRGEPGQHLRQRGDDPRGSGASPRIGRRERVVVCGKMWLAHRAEVSWCAWPQRNERVKSLALGG